MAGIVRNDVDALIETQVANEIFEGTIRQSKALSMFKRLPNATSDKTKIRVLDSLPVAYFVDETTDNGRKNITKLAWDKKYINIAELAVIVPIKENLLNDASIDIWATVRPRVEEAFARKIDNAMFFGVDKPTDWRAGLVPSIVSVGAEVNETTNDPVTPDTVSIELPEFDTKYTKTVGEYTVQAEKWRGGSVGGFGIWLYKNGQLVDQDSYLSRAYFYMDGEWKWSNWGNGEDGGTYHKYPVSNDVEIREIEVKF